MTHPKSCILGALALLALCMPARANIVMSYELPEKQFSTILACARTADPPICLVERSSGLEDILSDTGYFLSATIVTGATGLVEEHRAQLLAAATRLYGVRGVLYGPTLEPQSPIQPSDTQAIVAAIALAAAAQNSARPFEDPAVQRLAGDADRALIAAFALEIWAGVDTHDLYSSPMTTPPGLGEIWTAAAAIPPKDDFRLFSLIFAVTSSPLRDRGLSMLQALVDRPDLPSETLLAAASLMATVYHRPEDAERFMEMGGKQTLAYSRRAIAEQIAEARLYEEYDAASARLVVRGRLRDLNARSSYLRTEQLDALERAGARSELRELGDAYRRKARAGGKDPRGTSDLFALASDSYRRAGLRVKAIRAAREGLPFVVPAIRAEMGVNAWTFDAVPHKPKRNSYINTYSSELTPVTALCRAGAIDEAVASGNMTGIQRYHCAKETGRPASFDWVANDMDWFGSWRLASEIIVSGDRDRARQFHDALLRVPVRATAADDSQPHERYALLGVMAAVNGQGALAASYFEKATASLPNSIYTTKYDALSLAEAWYCARAILAARHAPAP